MNFLAHARLSFYEPPILVGNMISDFVKGKKQFDYPISIQKGIQLHRAIDNYTDTHDATQEAKAFFKPVYRLYAGAFIDVVYDHFLANDVTEFATKADLELFATDSYDSLQDNFAVLPQNFRQLLPYMISQDWFTNYRSTKGLQQSFNGLVRRSKYLTESDQAFEIFTAEYAVLQSCYQAFYPDVKNFAAHHLQELLNS